MKLYRVVVEVEMFVVAPDVWDAERTAKMEIREELDHAVVTVLPALRRDTPSQWLRALPYGENPAEKTVEQWLELSNAQS